MLCFFFVLFRNQEFLSGGYYNSIRLIGAYLFIFASVKSCDWIKKAPQIITAVGIANVIATLLFFVNNGLYQLFINTTYNIKMEHKTDCMGIERLLQIITLKMEHILQ